MWLVQTIEKEAKKEVEDALAKAKVCTVTRDVVVKFGCAPSFLCGFRGC